MQKPNPNDFPFDYEVVIEQGDSICSTKSLRDYREVEDVLPPGAIVEIEWDDALHEKSFWVPDAHRRMTEQLSGLEPGAAGFNLAYHIAKMQTRSGAIRRRKKAYEEALLAWQMEHRRLKGTARNSLPRQRRPE